MVALRSLVAVLVTVLTLFGGAFRAQTVLRAQLSIQNASDDAEQASFDRGRTVVQGRATKSSAPNARDGVSAALHAMRRPFFASLDVRETTATAPATAELHRRVRPHVEHMVFLI